MARRALTDDQLAVVQAARSALQRSFFDARPVRIGCSGGADSMALTAACAHLVGREFLGLPVEVVVVDHGLQAGSAELAADVVKRCEALGLSARAVRVAVDVHSSLGMEAAARAARYAALTAPFEPLLGRVEQESSEALDAGFEVAASGSFEGDLLIAHSLDDQAETVLLGLARGSGTRSLAGMAPLGWLDSTRVIRPLLGLRRQTLRRAAEAWDLEIWDDPHNQLDDFARVRVRNVVLPTMVDQLGAQVVAALARTAELARADADTLDAQAADACPDPLPTRLPITDLRGRPPAIASRIVRRWLTAQGVLEPSAGHIAAVMSLVVDWRGQTGVDMPGGIRILRRDDALVTQIL